MRSLTMVAAGLLSACDLVIALDENPSEVSVSYEVREVRNSADGVPVASQVSDPRFFEVTLEDGTVPALVTPREGVATFVRDSEQERYRLAVRMPDDAIVEYQLAMPQLAIVEAIIGRNDRQFPSTLDVQQLVPNAPANTTTNLVTTGLWTETPHTVARAGATNMSFVFAWPSARRKFGAPGILAAASGDRAYATTSTFRLAKRGAGYFALTHACEDTFSTLGVQTNATLQCSVVPVPLERCLHLKTDFATELARIAGVLSPGTHPTKAHGWFIGASPAPGLMPQVTLDLGSRFAFTTAETPATETDDEVLYGNPFAGHEVTVRLNASHERPFTHPLATSHTNLETRTRYWSAPAATCDTPEPAPSLVALPHAVAIDGTPLDEDGRVVAIDPARELQVTWSVSEGDVDLYRVVLHEIVELFTFTVRAQRRTYVVTERAVVLDPSLLQPNRIYAIEVEAHAGAPDVRSGKLGTVELPYAIGSGWSSTFQVP